jgi:hypothetical protein
MLNRKSLQQIIITEKKHSKSIAKSSLHCDKSTQENNAHFTQHQQKHSRKEFVCRSKNKKIWHGRKAIVCRTRLKKIVCAEQRTNICIKRMAIMCRKEHRTNRFA